MTTRYPIRIGSRSRLFLRLAFGVTPERAYVELGDEVVRARFGRFSFTAPVAGVTRWRIEGPWRWITAIGVRMNVTKRDVSFCGSPRGGVRLDFEPRVPCGRLRILTVRAAIAHGSIVAHGTGRPLASPPSGPPSLRSR